MHVAILVFFVSMSIVSLDSLVFAQVTVTLQSPNPGSIQGKTSFCLTWAAAGNASNVKVDGPFQDVSGGAVNCYAWKDTGWVETPPGSGHWEAIDSADGFGWAQYYPEYGRGWTSVNATAHKTTFAGSAAYAQSAQFETKKKGTLQGTLYWVSHANLKVEGNQDPIDTLYVESVSKLKTQGTTDENTEVPQAVNGKLLDQLIGFSTLPEDSKQAIQNKINSSMKKQKFTLAEETEEFYHLEVLLNADGKFTVSSSAKHLCDPKKLARLGLINFDEKTSTIAEDSKPSSQANESPVFQSGEGMDYTKAVLDACPQETGFVRHSAFKVDKSNNVSNSDKDDHPVVLTVHKPFRTLIFVPFDSASDSGPPRETALSLGQTTRVRENTKPGAKK